MSIHGLFYYENEEYNKYIEFLNKYEEKESEIYLKHNTLNINKEELKEYIKDVNKFTKEHWNEFSIILKKSEKVFRYDTDDERYNFMNPDLLN